MEYILRLTKDEYELLKVIIENDFGYIDQHDEEYAIEKSIKDKLGIK